MHGVSLFHVVFFALRLKLRYGFLFLNAISLPFIDEVKPKSRNANVCASREKSQNNTKYLHQHTLRHFDFFYFLFILDLVSLAFVGQNKV